MSLLFQPEHIDQIRSGEKTVTRRDWDDGYARPTEGSIQMAVTELFTSDADADCYIRITDVDQEPLGAMDAADAEKEGGYSLAEFRELWTEMHGAWDPEQVVDVVAFEYVGRERPEQSEVHNA